MVKRVKKAGRSFLRRIHGGRFDKRLRRSFYIGWSLSGVFHLFLSFLFLWYVSPHLNQNKKDKRTEEYRLLVKPVQMYNVIKDPLKPHVPKGVNKESIWNLLDVAIKDQGKTDKQKPEDDKARTDKLKEISKSANMVSNKSMEEIAMFLGKKPGSYTPRTEYINEMNPNLNMGRAQIIATDYKNGSVTIVLEDLEKDRFVCILDQQKSDYLIEQKCGFDSKSLTNTYNEIEFELKNAKITNIKSARNKDGKIIPRTCEVVFTDKNNKVLALQMSGKSAKPFQRERIRFMRDREGKYLYRDDETTQHGEMFDFSSATIYSVDDLSKEKGYPCARQVMIDAKGERFISIVKDTEAVNLLRNTKSINSNPKMKKLYQTIVAPLLPGMHKKQMQGKNPVTDMKKEAVEKYKQQQDNNKTSHNTEQEK